ncbi:MAG: RNA polymerase sigma factor SigE, partial [Planctomycetes bacterium]|nr:RNA polymerase sigma factor SigE [Planctomycetota bacterium]
EGLSYDEVSAILGCRIGTAKSRIHRARMALKDAMVALWPEEFET